ncbi:MAG: hypothetical protein OD816_000450 [Thermodesulfobacterium sp.]|uniref:Uncharacterized protein n=1 Tax=Candidatus Thermodesulfobacterium syntrophicum TaxID=3060442 RepID=A0AAE3P3T4_9BACT|nr:hypothetical protein [Candidatus Thermodesulfobacterium syntrophicum]
MNKSILIVGGLDRLVNRYKEIAHAFKYQFYHHCGKSSGLSYLKKVLEEWLGKTKNNYAVFTIKKTSKK